MNYDKGSFLAGLAVGRQLKGWGQSPGQSRCPRADPEAVFDFAAAEMQWPVTAEERI